MLLIYQAPQNENFKYPSTAAPAKIIFEDLIAKIRIRTISLTELVAIRDNWLVAEGWPSIKYTLAATYANDPEGFYVLEKDGEKIASISVVTYPETNSAYIGFYVVTKPYRGQGYGKLIINKTIEYSMQQRGINSFGLNCITSAVPMYQNYGFTVVTVDDFWRYTMPQAGKGQADQELVQLDSLHANLFTDLVNYDYSILHAHRTEFLNNFLHKPCTTTVLAQTDGKINGYGVMSEREPATADLNKSFRIGALYADDIGTAKNILQQLMANVKLGESVFVESPGNNPAAAALMQDLGFEKTGAQAKMFKGVMPNFAVERMFCYNSVAIGG
jgi:predicted GNAT family N-acyltransferase